MVDRATSGLGTATIRKRSRYKGKKISQIKKPE